MNLFYYSMLTTFLILPCLLLSNLVLTKSAASTVQVGFEQDVDEHSACGAVDDAVLLQFPQNNVSRIDNIPYRACNASSVNRQTAVVGDSAPGPGILCDKNERDPCITVIGDECCATTEMWWCEGEPMCSERSQNHQRVSRGLTPPITGIFCPILGEFQTCYEAPSFKAITETGYFCPHDYFWEQHDAKACGVSLKNPHYHVLRFAKAACINNGDACWGVYDTNCDGYELTYLCDASAIQSADDLLPNSRDCVHEKLYRTPVSYYSLCTEEGTGLEHFSPEEVFPQRGAFCPDNDGACVYVNMGDKADAEGTFCSDPDYLIGETQTFTYTSTTLEPDAA